VELVDAQVIQNFYADPSVVNQLNQLNADRDGRKNADDEKSNQVSGDIGDYTRWNLPEGAKRKIGKGRITDIQLSPDSTSVAIADNGGIWLYDVNSGDEIARLTEHTRKTEEAVTRVLFSPDGKHSPAQDMIISSEYMTLSQGKTYSPLICQSDLRGCSKLKKMVLGQPI
ncbi:hypothetical protein JT359_07215, partial [Candidatus Poribacteria bacterium]|nr:hypothetical protein [Candidatus Poribacteria bacterium]